jgi:hypothetical protein
MIEEGGRKKEDEGRRERKPYHKFGYPFPSEHMTAATKNLFNRYIQSNLTKKKKKNSEI